MSFIYTWLLSHLGINGSVLAALGIALPIFNLIMSTIQTIFTKLSLTEPGWLQTIGTLGLTITQWLSANIPSVQQQIQKK